MLRAVEVLAAAGFGALTILAVTDDGSDAAAVRLVAVALAMLAALHTEGAWHGGWRAIRAAVATVTAVTMASTGLLADELGGLAYVPVAGVLAGVGLVAVVRGGLALRTVSPTTRPSDPSV